MKYNAYMDKKRLKILGLNIKVERIKKQLYQKQLAEKINLSYQQIQKYEYNKATPPLDKLTQICKILEIPSEVFFKDSIRKNLIDRIEFIIEKNYELVKILDDNPELHELIKSYSKNKSHLKVSDLLKILNDLINLPKEKIELCLAIISKVLMLVK